MNTNDQVKVGQNKCPSCGSTEIILNSKNGYLKCNYCSHEFTEAKTGELNEDLSHLTGQVVEAGAKDIVEKSDDIMTLRCEGCGAEIVIDTSENFQAICHWCQGILSINGQIPNGIVPDMVLPFNISKEEAQKEIKYFVDARRRYAHPKFTKKFNTANISGVYFPYMIVDVNAHANLVGTGEHLHDVTKQGSSKYYTVDTYNIERSFDLEVDNLTIESSSARSTKIMDQTNNIINAIMPFDIENCVIWNPNYLKGYHSEKRDLNVKQLKEKTRTQVKDIARYAANDTLTHYDRGVCWTEEELYIQGEQWKSAYLPVWLYSFQEVKLTKKILHYVAVNARTKETIGSVPIHQSKVAIQSVFAGIIALLAIIFIYPKQIGILIGVLIAIFTFFYMTKIYYRYRNVEMYHRYEKETKIKISNVEKTDKATFRKRGVRESVMKNANNRFVNGDANQQILMEMFEEEMTNKNSEFKNESVKKIFDQISKFK